MGYLISAYFDADTNRILSRYIRDIAARTGNGFMTDNQVPPHLTISFFEARSEEEAKEAFVQMRERLGFDDIIIPSVGTFFPNVIYAEAVQNEYLLNISREVNDVLEGGRDIIVNKYYKPLSWLPHITLGKTLDETQMRIAFEYLQKNFQLKTASVVRFGLAKTNPHREILSLD